MTIRTDLIRSAARATETLGEAACRQVRAFLNSRRQDGAFVGRSGQVDLYYTVFALQAWQALGQGNEPAPVDPQYLLSFAHGDGLDFVHLCCLIRCWACLLHDADGATDHATDRATLTRTPFRLGVADHHVSSLRHRLLSFRLSDGGFSHSGAGCSSAYGCFLGLAALQDLAKMEPAHDDGTDSIGLLACLARLRCDGGGYANPPADAPSAPATAAALVTLTQLDQPTDDQSVRRLLDCRGADGGFRANQLTPIGDLLSTATALHALSAAGADLQPLREPTLDFLSSLWSPQGGFRGHAFDDELDCEYTFYGLLAAGTVATPQ